ncbi:DUF397 domain-containing protein [Actinomadura chibensis]|uniref:DUF397 domain-containing protein n=1 Tax=Actinomadura chibensis TaxID=392828 RepID=A0A5D0NPM8_9ACTN|nr:DUF397 domain-containing protein [Actinomadura chibensis]TYB46447.1 DUF397 domain-containing protein [Actinomadura chibensis]
MDLNTAAWRKASRSTSNGGACVELARINDFIAIRDSKNPNGPKIVLTPAALDHFTRLIKNA